MTARTVKKKAKGGKIVHQAGPLTIREVRDKKDQYTWTTFLVQGWQEKGSWKRRKFKSLEDAKGFVALKQVEIINSDTVLKTVVTSLTHERVQQAEAAFRRLGERYSLDQVVDYFVRNHHDPEKPKDFKTAIEEFLKAKQASGLQPRSLRALSETLSRFEKHILLRHNVERLGVHDISSADVVSFLKSLRGKDDKEAKRKTYNNNRLELSSFFSWASDRLQRFTPENPVASVDQFDKKAIEQQREPIAVLEPDQVRKLFEYLKAFKRGAYCKYYALALFAGLRPESEILRLNDHPRQKEILDLKHQEIELPIDVTPKSAVARTVKIRPNLMAWLKAYPGPILPKVNVIRDLEKIRKTMNLSQDICRHSWFTYSIGDHDSVATAALEGGNSEAVVKKHYFRVARGRKVQTKAYWSIFPDPNQR